MTLVRLIAAHARLYLSFVIAVIVLQLVAVLAALYLPTINADIIDDGIAQGDVPTIWRLGGWMLAVTVVNILAMVAANWCAARVGMSVGRDLRSAVFHRVQGFSRREMGSFSTASLITRSTNDAQQVQMLVFFGLNFIVQAPITGIGGVVLALNQEPGLAWLIAVMVPVMLVVIGGIVWKSVPLFRQMQERIDEINLVLREQITGIRPLRAFVREDYERSRFEEANLRYDRVNKQVGNLMVLIQPTIMFLLSFSSVVVLAAAAGPVDRGEMQIGSITAFIAYLIQILIAVMMATFMTMMIPRAMVSAERITEVLHTEPAVHPPSADEIERPLDPADGTRQADGSGPADGARPADRVTLEFDDVSYTFDGADRPVLNRVSFTAHGGQTVAIIGGTGAGKSTLLGAITRAFDVTSGAVRINGVDVRRADPAMMDRAFGYVPQRPYLFSGTVRSTVGFGRDGTTDEDIWHALTVAQARDFVAAMPQQLDSPISQGGTNVSGGQRQRLSIARALVGRPPIYLFDDSFSALDLSTDARLRAALEPETRDALVVIVAQRVSTIVDADLILVLDHGEVVGRGTHEELMADSATYREIVESQGGIDGAGESEEVRA
ncbi:ABC transporter ATP-binding protein [Helcobacillus massiliensis]|uniref:ABC transporter ATP-binding protein n=1 Tax=Helcobacillus massiliensis TaxID=521392 RepID=UPI002557861F|nr:ABC transporter ATP-binding protein [Helcobacillus massiliensis]MDK7742402.1 ABC transporter ATP-binding protein [Helcobacillus massiliensis]WOO92511.1 ABC transporter ATP-binding protein [Helcobacillus massiliensis]